MPTKTSGGSGKPLYQKLGIKAGMRCMRINAPENYDHLIDGAPDFETVKSPDLADLVHLFVRNQADLTATFSNAACCVDKNGMIWVSWPKKSSPLFQDLTEDGIRDIVLKTDWVDVKVCAVDEDWSALKFLRRTTSRKQKSAPNKGGAFPLNSTES